MGNNKIARTFIFEFNSWKTLKKLIPLLLFSLLFAACQQESQELDFINYSVERSYEQCNPENANCSYIRMEYPVASSNNATARNINREIENHLRYILDYEDEQNAKSAEAIAESFIRNYGKTKEDFPEYETAWEASIYGEVTYTSEELVSISFNSEVFTGGAHGYTSMTWLNFNPETGEIYKMEEIFTEDFSEFVEVQFRKEFNIAEDASINSTGLFFEEDKFHLPQNIGFNGNGIVLYYNVYEIASYADGPFTMSFSKNKIAQYLKIEL